MILAFFVDGTPKPVPDEFFRDGGIERPEYLVTHDDRGWRCTCPDWIYRLSKRKGQCKHIIKCLPELPRFQAVIAWWRNEIGARDFPGAVTSEERMKWLEG